MRCIPVVKKFFMRYVRYKKLSYSIERGSSITVYRVDSASESREHDSSSNEKTTSKETTTSPDSSEERTTQADKSSNEQGEDLQESAVPTPESLGPARPPGMLDIPETDFLTNCSWVRDKVAGQIGGMRHNDTESKRKMVKEAVRDIQVEEIKPKLSG